MDEHDPQWQNFIISGENSVVKTWLRRGASGWRLDVADELPDDVLCLIRKAVKSEKEDAPIIGEVWENAVTKESYGEKRQYALGGALDSVMNYPFRTAVLGFLKGDIDACGLRDFLISQQSDYPPPLYGALMNLLGSHDVERLLTALGTDSDIKKMNRDEQLELELTADMEKKAVQLEKLAAAIQFTVPGVPCVYYGDEQGMQGGRDPFNRRFFQKHNIELHKYYVNLSKLRNTSDVLKCGDMKVRAINTDMIEIVRYVNKTALTLTIDRAVPSVRFSPESGIYELLNF